MIEDLNNHKISFPGQFLHAGNLGLVHPTTNESVQFQCEPPINFMEALSFLNIPSEVWQKEFLL